MQTTPTGILYPEPGEQIFEDAGFRSWYEAIAQSADTAIQQRALIGHIHSMGDVTGLITALAQKAGVDDPRLTDSRFPKPHTHEIDEVDGLLSAVSNKAETFHDHSLYEINGLSDELSRLDTRISEATGGEAYNPPIPMDQVQSLPDALDSISNDINTLDESVSNVTYPIPMAEVNGVENAIEDAFESFSDSRKVGRGEGDPNDIPDAPFDLYIQDESSHSTQMIWTRSGGFGGFNVVQGGLYRQDIIHTLTVQPGNEAYLSIDGNEVTLEIVLVVADGTLPRIILPTDLSSPTPVRMFGINEYGRGVKFTGEQNFTGNGYFEVRVDNIIVGTIPPFNDSGSPTHVYLTEDDVIHGKLQWDISQYPSTAAINSLRGVL